MFNYKKMWSQISSFALFVSLPFFVLAQESVEVNPDLTKVQLPPLESLFQNAKNNPGIEMYATKVESQKSLLTTEQRSWLKYFKIGGSYQYGNIAVNSAFTNEYTPLFNQTTGQIQNSWYGTVGISIPLDDLFDRKNKLNRIKLDIKSTEFETAKFLDELHLRITESYMNVKLHLSTLHKQAEEFYIAKGNFQMIESEFKLSNATISALNVAKRQETEAFERLKVKEFAMLQELIKLEILSKTKIISK